MINVRESGIQERILGEILGAVSAVLTPLPSLHRTGQLTEPRLIKLGASSPLFYKFLI